VAVEAPGGTPGGSLTGQPDVQRLQQHRLIARFELEEGSEHVGDEAPGQLGLAHHERRRHPLIEPDDLRRVRRTGAEGQFGKAPGPAEFGETGHDGADPARTGAAAAERPLDLIEPLLVGEGHHPDLTIRPHPPDEPDSVTPHGPQKRLPPL
jgi:hypothetical protein